MNVVMRFKGTIKTVLFYHLKMSIFLVNKNCVKHVHIMIAIFIGWDCVAITCRMSIVH